ncbi:MAG TPA: TonB-dependent receptor [Terriglobus sp.]
MISGRVVDASGAVIPGVSVTAKVAGGASYRTQSDKLGIYQFSGLQAADYEITAESPGFTTVIQKVSVLVGQSATVNATLTASAGNTSVTVSSEAQTIDTTTSQVSGNIDPQTMAKIPLNGRNYMDLATLIPGIRRNAITNYSPLGTLNGGRQQFNLDGQQVTANSADSSFGQAQFSRDALSQFQIITNQFDATQGRTSQLVMNMQSKSGLNDMHGTLFGYFRNDVFDAKDPITKTVLPFSDQQYGGTLGGKVIKDKVWYFGSYEGERRPQQTNTTLVGFTSGQLSYSLDNTLRTNEYLFRGDYQPDEKDHIFLRYFRYDSKQPDLLPSGTSSISRQYSNTFADYGYIASWTRNISSNLVNTLFHGWYYQQGVNLPLVPSMQMTFPTQVIGAAYNYPSYLPVSNFQFRDDAFWLHGKHSFKFGAEYLYIRNHGSFPQNVRGTVTISTDPTKWSTPRTWDSVFPNQLDPTTWDYAAISPYVTSYTQAFGNFDVKIDRNQLGFWINDDWKVSRNTTLNLGIRYDNDLGLITAGNNTINGVVTPKNGNNWNFSPRFGFNIDVYGNGKTVVRGGGGIYFAEIIANQSIDAQVFNGVNTVQAAATISPGFSLLKPFGSTDPNTFVQNPQNVYQSIQVNGPSIRTPWSAQGTIGVQQELPYQTTVSLDYVQFRTHHDWTRVDANSVYDPSTGWNQATIGAVSAACPNGCFTSRVQPNTHYSVIQTFLTPDYVANMLKQVMFSARKRTSFGFTGMVSYTYGLQKDNGASPFSYASNPYNYANEWANSVDDQHHTLAATGDYTWKYGIRGGLVFHYGSGLAYATSVSASAPTVLVQSASVNRSFCVKPTTYVSGALPGTVCSHVSTANYISPSALHNDPSHNHYDAATGLTTTDRNSFRGLPVERVDANLAKVFTFRDRYRVTTAVEAFNLFNHSNYGSYTTNISLATYGAPASTSGVLAFYARQLQFSARLDF